MIGKVSPEDIGVAMGIGRPIDMGSRSQRANYAESTKKKGFIGPLLHVQGSIELSAICQ